MSDINLSHLFKTDPTSEDDSSTTNLPEKVQVTTKNDHVGIAIINDLLNNPNVSQIVVNGYDQVFYRDRSGDHQAQGIFLSMKDYGNWLNNLLSKISPPIVANRPAGDTRPLAAYIKSDTLEGSFNPLLNPNLRGSVHLTMPQITHGEPALTIRKQPPVAYNLDDLRNMGLMSQQMATFLEYAIRGRSNILISGGSGTGKTTMARALSYYIPPTERLITAEEIDELYIKDRLPNAVTMFTNVVRDANGAVLRETTLEDLVKECLRMRADRIWVGETRGKEAFALIKACNSGHDGSVTTIHADNSLQALRQATTYVMEAGVPEQVALEQVVRAFDLIIQIAVVDMGRRVITEITEVSDTIENKSSPRVSTLYSYTPGTGEFSRRETPSRLFTQDWARYGVDYASLFPPNNR